MKKYRQTDNCKSKKKVYMQKYQQTEKYKAWAKAYQQTPEYKAKSKERQQTQEYKSMRKIYMENLRQTDKFKSRKKVYERDYMKKRLSDDLQFKLRVLLRIRLNRAINNNVKLGSAVRDLGCSVDELKIYLENQFTDNMTWQNWGRAGKSRTWHIDHIKPLSKFDLTNRQQFLEACHYTNLQPMWAIDNIKKGNKL